LTVGKLEHYPNFKPRHLLVQNIPQRVLDCQIYAHYQGGTIAGAYQWDKDRKMWVHNPTNADGNAGWVITGNTNYKNNWGN